MKIKESRSRKIFKVFNYTFLTLLGLATFYPFWYVLIASFNTGRDFMRGGVWIWPRAFTLENYQMAFEDPTIGTSPADLCFGNIVINCIRSDCYRTCRICTEHQDAAGKKPHELLLVLYNDLWRRHGSLLHGAA